MQEPLPPAGASNRFTTALGGGVDGRTGRGRQVGDRTVICGYRMSQRDRACRVPEHWPEAGDLRCVVHWDDTGTQEIPSSGPALAVVSRRHQRD